MMNSVSDSREWALPPPQVDDSSDERNVSDSGSSKPVPRLRSVSQRERGEGEESGSQPVRPRPPTVPVIDPFAEFEGDLDDEVTRINHDQLIAEENTRLLHEAEKPAYLYVTAGKDHGKRFALGSGDTTVGRSVDNDVILTDASVSRRHFRIEKKENGYHFWDLGSGNGSHVNGSRVHDVALVDGDRIEVGESVLCVEAPSCPRSHHAPVGHVGYSDAAGPPGAAGFSGAGFSGAAGFAGASEPASPPIPASVPIPGGMPDRGMPAPLPGTPYQHPGDYGSFQGIPGHPLGAPVVSGDSSSFPGPPPRFPGEYSTPVAPPPANAPIAPTLTAAAARRRKPPALILAAAVVSVALVVGLVATVVVAFWFRSPAQEPVQAEVPVDALYDQGIQAMEDRRFEEAIHAFEKIVFYRPSQTGAREKLVEAQAALEHRTLLENARGFMRENQWARALDAAGRIPTGSLLSEDARALTQDARANLLAEKVAGARQALEEGDLSAARQRARIARQLNPSHPAVRQLLTDLTAAEEASEGNSARVAPTPSRPRPTRSPVRASREGPGASQSRLPAGGRGRGSRSSSLPPPAVSLPRATAPRPGATEQLLAEARRHGTRSTAGCQTVRRAMRGGGSNPEVSNLWQQCVANAQQLLERARSRPPSVKRHMLHQVIGMVGPEHAIFSQAQTMLANLPQDEDE